MIMLAISTDLAIVIGFSVLMFALVTLFCYKTGSFDGSDTLGIGAVFTWLFYLAFWIVPSLVAWAAWATWWR